MKKKLLIMVGLFASIAILAFLPFMIQLNGNKEITIEVYEPYEDAGASLRIEGNLKVTNNVDSNKVGDYSVVYQWFTQKKKRIVHVVDSQAPTIELSGEDEIEVLYNHTYREPGYNTSDNYDHEVSVERIVNVDTTVLGDYSVEYIAKDSSGNITTAKRIVHVVEDDYQYQREIIDQAGIPQEVSNVIVNFYNLYYRSIKYLEYHSFESLYSNPKFEIMDYAVSYLVENRKQSHLDLTLEDCYYDLTYSNVSYSNNVYTITVYEEAYLNFRSIMDITSRLGGIKNTIRIERTENGYKVNSFEKEEGFYSIFYEGYEKGVNLNQLYNDSLTSLTSQNNKYEQDRLAVVNQEVSYDVTASHPYDREAAVAYAKEYWHTRNENYKSFESNCMNFGSQCLLAGGIPMDYSGSWQQQWKYYDGNYNEAPEARGFIYTWTFIPYFRNYVANNNQEGLVASLNVNLYLAQGGDMLQIGSGSEENLVHNMVVVDTICNEKGEIVDILVSGNTNDMSYYPLSAGAYPYKALIKIAGYN